MRAISRVFAIVTQPAFNPSYIPTSLYQSRLQISHQHQIAMDGSTAPGSLIWNPNDCTGFSATPILPNNTGSDRVCGYQTRNTSLLQSCCSSGEVKQYACWSYCATDRTFPSVASCLNKNLGSPNATNSPHGLFCQGNSTGTIREQVSSSTGVPRVPGPTFGSVMLLACLVAAFLIAPTSAAIIPSLDPTNKLARRQSSSCQYNEDHHFVRAGRQRKVSPSFSGFASQGVPIDSGIENNNRTINGTSAASSSYDAFFDVLANTTGRQFPAMSSVELTYEFSCGTVGQTCYATFMPWQWCTNGTATGCEDELQSGDAMAMEACGPVFVSDNNSTEPQTAESMEGAMIQGVLTAVVSDGAIAWLCMLRSLADPTPRRPLVEDRLLCRTKAWAQKEISVIRSVASLSSWTEFEPWKSTALLNTCRSTRCRCQALNY